MKKITSLILAVIMSVSIVTSAGAVEYGAENANKPTKTYTQKFSDVPSSHWAFSYIGEMTERGVVAGYPNGTFCPNNDVTRAEFAKIMTSASGIQISNPTTKDFEDVSTSAWYAPYIHAAYPYLSGYYIYGGNYYMPDTPALREDIAVALVKLKGYDTMGADETILSAMFKDEYSISDDARKYVAVALERGLVSGYDDDTFRGQDSISRAEATAMLWRAYQYGNDNKTFDTATQKPVAQTTPVPIATPTVAPTPTPVTTKEPTPTSEPTSTPEPQKPYVIDTITKANIKDEWSYITQDNNNNIYYYDTDRKIYSVNMESETSRELYDLSDLKMTEDGELLFGDVGDETSYYFDFSVDRILYDTQRNKLLCAGNFESFKDWKDLDESYRDSDTMILAFDDDNIDKYSYQGSGTMRASTDEGILFTDNNIGVWGYKNSSFAIYNLEKDEVETHFTASFGHLTEYSGTLLQFVDGELYGLITSNSGGCWLRKYDFSSASFIEVQAFEGIKDSRFSIGYSNNKFYAWDTGGGNVIECLPNGKLSYTGINTKENVDVLDRKNIPSFSRGMLFISDSEKFVFYDEDNSSIRVIKKR